MNKKQRIHWIVSLLIMFAVLPHQGDAGPLKKECVHSSQEAESSPFNFTIQVFRNFISGADGDRCAMVPSCSKYALEAVRKHGSVIGWVMTCDRLLRCGLDETRHTPPVRVGHRILSKDPVESNDFWWK